MRLLLCLILILSFRGHAGQQDQVHVVQSGESLMTISYEYYGTHQNWRKIIEANEGIQPETITIGDKILIPNVSNDVVVNKPVSVEATAQEPKAEVAPLVEVKKEEVGPEIVKLEPAREAGPEIEKLEPAREAGPEIVKLEPTDEKVEVKTEPVVAIAPVVAPAMECPEVAPAPPKSEEKVVSQDKYLEMKQLYLETKEELKQLEASEVKLKITKDRIVELKDEIFELKNKISGLKKDDMKFMESHPLYQANLLTYSSKQILQEKSRILTQKLWLEKNKNYGKCHLNLSSLSDKVSKELTTVVDYLNETYGVPNVFVTSDDHTIYFKIPGRYVYGYSKPKLTNTAKRNLLKLSDLLEKLPVSKLILHSYSKKKYIKDENERRIGADEISFKRGFQIQDYFLEDLGWNRRKVKTVAAGHRKTIDNKYQRHFLFELVLDQYKNVNRSIASRFKDDKSINKIDKDILFHLNEPKYSKAIVNNHQFELNLSRQYFFSSRNSKLTDKGKAYIDKIFEMFSLAQEVKIRLTSTAGFNEKNYKENKRRATNQLLAIKSYVDMKFPWAAGRVELGFNPRQVKLRQPASKNDDLINKRVTFELIPLSLSLREFNQFETIEDK